MAEAPPSVGSAASYSASTPQWIGLPCVPELNIRKTKRVLLFARGVTGVPGPTSRSIQLEVLQFATTDNNPPMPTARLQLPKVTLLT